MASNLSSSDAIYTQTDMLLASNEELVSDWGTKVGQNTVYSYYEKGDCLNLCYTDGGPWFNTGTVSGRLKLSNKQKVNGTMVGHYSVPVDLYFNDTLKFSFYAHEYAENVLFLNGDISSYGSTGYLNVKIITACPLVSLTLWTENA